MFRYYILYRIRIVTLVLFLFVQYAEYVNFFLICFIFVLGIILMGYCVFILW